MVAGAGMVGATAACLFAKQGLNVGLLDSHCVADWQTDSVYPRVSAVNVASVNIFQDLGVWQSILDKRASPYQTMRVREDGSDAGISFNAHTMGQAQLGFIIENNAIISSLMEKLRPHYNVSIMESTALLKREVHQNKLVLETDNNQSFECSLLVGADGARSTVREMCGINAALHDYDQDAIVTVVEIEKSHKKTAWQSFLPTGPVALLPLSDGRCSVVWSSDRGFAENLMRLSDDGFCGALSTCFERQIGRIQNCSERLRFPLRQHHAPHYIARYTALAGDAAHVTHPLAGLGANLGFTDAAALAEVVDQARSKGKNIASHAVLRRYERWRQGENALVLTMMKGFKNIFGRTEEPVKTARQCGLNLVDQMPPLKHQFARYAMGLSGDLPKICR